MKRLNFNKAEHQSQFKRLTFAADLASDGTKIVGYATKWDKLSGDRGGFLAMFPKGSVRFPSYPITLQYNHNDDWLLASEGAGGGALLVTVDDVGIRIEATLGSTFIDQYVLEKMKAGVIRGMSLGMYAIKYHREARIITAEDAADNPELQPLVGQTIEIEIYDEWVLDEVTITGRPALPQTEVVIVPPPPITNPAPEKETPDDLTNYELEVELIDAELE